MGTNFLFIAIAKAFSIKGLANNSFQKSGFVIQILIKCKGEYLHGKKSQN
jgi:hypothetical protein